MGCCLTTPTTTTTAAGDAKPSSKPHGGGPPPPPPEEETVKEVLSETPITTAIKPPPTKISGKTQQTLRLLEESRPPNDVVPPTKNRTQNDVVGHPINKMEETHSEVSSEMYYTYSESFSAATTTTTTTSFATDLKKTEIGKEEEDGEVNQRIKKKRPPEKMAPRKRPPEKMANSVRRKERGVEPPVRRSAVPSRNITTGKCRRNLVKSDAGRRDPPVRRSRSPAVRSPVPKSGGRVPVNTTENGGKFRLKKTSDGGVTPAPVPESESEICESLENPLVSLECFIFL